MDQLYMNKMASSFLDELLLVQKEAMSGAIMKGLSAGGRFLASGAKGLGRAATKTVPGGMNGMQGLAYRLGGKGATQAGGVLPHMKQIYQAGGLSGLARSRYAQMGTVAGLGALGAQQALGSKRRPQYR